MHWACFLLILLPQFVVHPRPVLAYVLTHSNCSSPDTDPTIYNIRLCYKPRTADIPRNATLLPNVASMTPAAGKSVFFHETSCSSRYVSLTVRQACAIESTARLNPHSQVYVLFASPRFTRGRDTHHLYALFRLRNVHFANVNLWQYAKGTPVEQWLNSSALFRSSYLVSHLSDLLRFLSLYKFQGTYLDLDVISLKPLGNTTTNYAVAQNSQLVASGMINLAASAQGRRFGRMLLRDFAKNFAGYSWARNGPEVMTRLLWRLCRMSHFNVAAKSTCGGFSVLPKNTAYPISFPDWEQFFNPYATAEVMRTIEGSTVVHFWNKLSAQSAVTKDDGSAYDQLARRHCPAVHRAAGRIY